jgi:hypothetical protein
MRPWVNVETEFNGRIAICDTQICAAPSALDLPLLRGPTASRPWLFNAAPAALTPQLTFEASLLEA